MGSTVKRVVEADLVSSSDPLIITGYASLDKLLSLLAQLNARSEAIDRVRLLLGHEPSPTKTQSPRHSEKHLSEEIRDYWLDHGISLYQSTNLLASLDILRSGKAQARISLPTKSVHAKIYAADRAITIGSSNYSWAGLVHQIEGNVRFTGEDAGRFTESRQLAEQIWDLGIDYTDQLMTLLEQLLQPVTWKEALARACAEILEGPWAQRYMKSSGEGPVLWPSQTQGLAQAMWVLENVGSVLLADATGSGKTRLGAHLIDAALHRLMGRSDVGRDDIRPILICPASVQENWTVEIADCQHLVSIYTDGMLSQSAESAREPIERQLRRAQVLAMDEAHRFLNPTTQRTRRILLNNLADHVLLFTATPVNRGPRDLLAIVDLLGADNFDDTVLDIFEHLLGQRRDSDDALSAGELTTLQGAIQQFTVRRTKAVFNQMIDREPKAYCNAEGQPCRFPEHSAKTYQCNEPKTDRELAREVNERTQKLHGLINLRRPLELTEAQRRDLVRRNVSDQEYLDRRLGGARGLARHQVLSSLRSSRAALLESLRGTQVACTRLGIAQSFKTTGTGNTIGTLQELAQKQPPAVHLEATPPDWLEDSARYAEACAQEIAVYEEIERLAEQISDAREESKARLLIGLLEHHPIVLAFDSRLITLEDVKKRIQTNGHAEVQIATGTNAAGRDRVKALAARRSTAQGQIALCSDAMSEGLNLQAASCVVHLDMPSVIRTAEQRAGRVDRLDSPHKQIAVWWPEDSPEFRLRADERFYARHQFVADVLGANFRVPNEQAPSITTQQLIDEYRAEETASRSWDGIGDAFEPVRALVFGVKSLIPISLYEQIRTSKARVVSSVSAVSASSRWAFFAVSGTQRGAPRWVYFDQLTGEPVTELQRISDGLRSHLDGRDSRPWDTAAAEGLDYFLRRLAGAERQLLPRKKQRTLGEMLWILERYRTQAVKQGDHTRREAVKAVLTLLEEHDRLKPGAGPMTGESDQPRVDLNSLADHWLELIRPIWYDHLKQRGRSRPLRLRHLRSTLVNDRPLSTDAIRELLQEARQVQPVDERVAAAIIGVPDTLS